jgi:hypothetical protein
MEAINDLIKQGELLINAAKTVDDAIMIRLPAPEPGSDRAVIWSDCDLNGEFSVYELELELQKLVAAYTNRHEQKWFSWLLWVLFDKKIDLASAPK